MKRRIIPIFALLLCVAGALVTMFHLAGWEKRAAALNNLNGLSGAMEPDFGQAANETTARFMGVLRIRDYVDAWQQVWEPQAMSDRDNSGHVALLAQQAKPLVAWRSYKTLDTEIGSPAGSRDALVRISAVDAKGRNVSCWFYLMQSRDGNFKVFGFGFPPSQPPSV